jgi:hypothetical protein
VLAIVFVDSVIIFYSVMEVGSICYIYIFFPFNCAFIKLKCLYFFQMKGNKLNAMWYNMVVTILEI